MKTYPIFIGIALVLTILTIGLPQLSGNIFVDSYETKVPKDWLSAQLLKYHKEIPEITYQIPANIRTICFQGGNPTQYHFRSAMYIKSGQRPHISYREGNKLTFSIADDSLHVFVENEYMPSLTLYIDSNVHNLVYDNIKRTEVHVNQTAPLRFSVQNKSDIAIRGNRNLQLQQMLVKEESTLSLNHCFTPTIDMQIDNSMVYIDPLNNIDSLRAHLIGKSNIKRQNTLIFEESNDFEILKKELNITKSNVSIFPTGNTYYLDQTKKENQ